MLRFQPWKVLLVVGALLVGVLLCVPNLFSEEARRTQLSWWPTGAMNLGLDLKGGASILLEIDPEELRTNELGNNVRRNIREELRKGPTIASTRREVIGDHLEVHIANPADVPAAVERIKRLGAPPLGTIGGQPSFLVEPKGSIIEVRFTEQALQKLQDDALASSMEAVRRRADNTGLVEPNIQKQGDSRIIVEVPGLPPEKLPGLIDTLTQAGVLTFNLVDEEATNQLKINPTSWPVGEERAGRIALPDDSLNGQLQVLETDTIITGSDLSGATQDFDQRNRPSISFQLHPAGAQRFGRVTSENVGRLFAIVLDNRVVSAPEIISPIMTGSGQITGSFTIEEAEQMAIVLRSGALPAKLKVADRRMVDASLGADSIRAGVMATVVGIVLITIFMLAAYGLLGLFALVAVYFNLALMIGILSGFGATLTLPGIAGMLLTMGMSVDGNVLQFERIREEKRAGRSPITSVEAGFDHSFMTILDSNMTHFIAGVVMFQLGAGPIRGFALTLALGIATSLFTSIMVTRLIIAVWLRLTRPKYIPI
jgi:protein-export membrane protein SecD